MIFIDIIFRVERKERARLKNVKFHGRGADAKGVSVMFLLTCTNHLFPGDRLNYKQLVLLIAVGCPTAVSSLALLCTSESWEAIGQWTYHTYDTLASCMLSYCFSWCWLNATETSSFKQCQAEGYKNLRAGQLTQQL